MNKKEIFYTLISPMYFHLQLSGFAYRKYLQNKIYLHAEALRSSNKRIARLLLKHAALIPGELQEDTLALLSHYDSWFAQFRIHKKKVKPEADDDFIFNPVDEQTAFPKSAEENIIHYYENLKQELEKARLVEHKAN